MNNKIPTFEQYQAAKRVLEGDEIKHGKVSDRAVFEAAGVSSRQFMAWIRRSRERRIQDPVYVWELAELWDIREDMHQDMLEDHLTGLAFQPLETVKYDAAGNVRSIKSVTAHPQQIRALLMLLRARDPRYRNDARRRDPQPQTPKMSAEDWLLRAIQWHAAQSESTPKPNPSNGGEVE